jgi:hypothetical protein
LTFIEGKSEYVRYVFLDVSLYCDDVARGDWISFEKKPYRVVDVQDGMVRLLDMDGKPLQTSGRQRAIFYKNLGSGLIEATRR